MLTDEEKKYACQAFDDIDETRSGFIPNTLSTLIQAAQLAWLNPTELETEKNRKETVEGYGEKINKEQFLEFMAKFEWKSREDIETTLKADFNMFDDNLTGYIEVDHLIHILTKEGRETIPEVDAEKFVSKYKVSENGKINIGKLIDTLLVSAPS